MEVHHKKTTKKSKMSSSLMRDFNYFCKRFDSIKKLVVI